KRGRRWSNAVTRHGDAPDPADAVFASRDPDAIARPLRRLAETSRRRTLGPCRSAVSLPRFWMNRAGEDLPGPRRNSLERAKTSLRTAFHRREAWA
ncbi:MAG TPA: DUF3175 domain-containing protein, partial [Acetobacteraceae bacterium]|nr:DUF3175 domain-containing protein [Acetobacteraceae bacterium]